jgi:hypothetical protein
MRAHSTSELLLVCLLSACGRAPAPRLAAQEPAPAIAPSPRAAPDLADSLVPPPPRNVYEWFILAQRHCKILHSREAVRAFCTRAPPDATSSDVEGCLRLCTRPEPRDIVEEAIAACAERIVQGLAPTCPLSSWENCIARCEVRARDMIRLRTIPLPPGGRIEAH